MNIFIKKNIGLWTIVVLTLIPILRWFFIYPLNFRFGSVSLMFTSLGQIAGLAGMMLFSLSLILSSRAKIIDRYFYGLPDVYNLHSKIGSLGFCLILFHPLFLVFNTLRFSIKDSAMFFIPQGLDAVSFGIYALILMIFLIVLTLYIKLKYHIWKFSHKFLILAFLFAVIHTVLIPSDISRDIFLRYYIIGSALLGLILSFYQAFLNKLFSKDLEYYVNKVYQLNENITQIELKPKKEYLQFMPGQFIFVKFFSKAVSSESHPFTISSDPQNKKLEFNIKSLGDFTSKIKNLKEGDKALIKGPYGKFSYKEAENKNQIWIAGGIGITPFLSMARSLTENNKEKIDLYYCIKNNKEAVLLDELLAIKAQNKNFNVIPWFSEERGLVLANNILELSSGIEDKDIFLCGPVSFMDSLRLQFLKLGIKNINIHWEKFGFN